MPDQGSVWDDGPQYPEMWPAPSGDSSSGLPDHTPQAMSPVDPDAPAPAPRRPAPASSSPAPSPSPKPPAPRRAWWRGPFLGVATWIWLATLTVLLVLLAILATSAGDTDPELVDSAPAASDAPATAPPATPSQPASQPTSPPTSPGTPVADTLRDVTAPDVTGGASAAPPVVPTTARTQPTAPPQPPSVAPTAAPPPVVGPAVTIVGRVAPCDFGSECLIVGFTIDGFDSQPTEFVCVFDDGSRYPFRFDSSGVERACATGDPTGSITIEVAGVRSETFRRT